MRAGGENVAGNTVNSAAWWRRDSRGGVALEVIMSRISKRHRRALLLFARRAVWVAPICA